MTLQIPAASGLAPASMIGTPEWWLERLLARLDLRRGRAPGVTLARTRRGSDLYDPGAPGMLLTDAYYHGQHRQTYKIRKVIDAFGLTMPLWINYCGVVVDTLAERIQVTGFNFHNDDRASSEASKIWSENNLGAGFNRGIRDGLTKGEFSLSIWPDADSGDPRIVVEDPLEVIVAVDPADPRRRRAALKRWVDEDAGEIFATLYLPGEIRKYRADVPAVAVLGDLVTAGGRGWRQRVATLPDGELEPWPLPNPFGEVPIFPIPNHPDSHGVGYSELEHVIPVQDAINANVANVMLAGLYGAFRQKWATNFQPVLDPKTGAPIMPWNISEDSIFTAPPPANPGQQPTAFGEFDQTDLAGYIALHETFIQALATTQRLPPHYLLGSSGVFPSGESLSAAERGLAEKAGERATDMKDPIEDAQRFAFLVASENPKQSSSARARFAKWAAMTDAVALFRDPEVKSEAQHIDALGKKRALLDVPRRQLWTELGATDDDRKQWETWLAEEEAAKPEPPPVPVPPTGPPMPGAMPDVNVPPAPPAE